MKSGISFLLPMAALACGSLSAATMYNPAFLSTNTTEINSNYHVTSISDQNGLSSQYVSGVTDYATYMALHPTQASNPLTSYYSNTTGPTGTFDFDLGKQVTLTNLIFWNASAAANTRASTISVIVSNTPDFATSTNVGTFTSSPSAAYPVEAEGFTLTQATARYVRITATNAGGSNLLIGEIAFAGTAAPEASTAAVAMVALAGSLLRRRRR